MATFRTLFLVLTFAGATVAGRAVEFDFFGTFTRDNDIGMHSFTLGTAGTVTFFTSSWDDGGFDPILGVWDSAGSKIAEMDDNGLLGSRISNSVSYDYGIWDAYFSLSLAAGSYTVTIAQYDNFALAGIGQNLSLGFFYDGAANAAFTSTLYGGTAPYFNGADNTVATGNYAAHVIVEPEEVPENVPDAAGVAGLLTFALAGLACVRRRLQA